MAQQDQITVINNKTLRGVLAPARVLSKKTLEDLVDFIELSSEKSAKDTAKRIREADKNKSWIPLEKVAKEVRKRK